MNQNTTSKLSQLPETQSREIPIHLIKSGYFRVIHVDGVWGSVTPSVNAIQMVAFSHRIPIPNMQVETISSTEGGELLAEVKSQDGKKGIVREMEAALIMNIETAKAIRGWLDKQITNLETMESKRKVS